MKNQRNGQSSKEIWKRLPPTVSYEKETTGGIDRADSCTVFLQKRGDTSLLNLPGE